MSSPYVKVNEKGEVVIIGPKAEGVLHDRIKRAVDDLAKTGNMREFAMRVANAGDVRYQWHKALVYHWIETYIPDSPMRNFVNMAAVNKVIKPPEDK